MKLRILAAVKQRNTHRQVEVGRITKQRRHERGKGDSTRGNAISNAVLLA